MDSSHIQREMPMDRLAFKLNNAVEIKDLL